MKIETFIRNAILLAWIGVLDIFCMQETHRDTEKKSPVATTTHESSNSSGASATAPSIKYPMHFYDRY